MRPAASRWCSISASSPTGDRPSASSGWCSTSWAPPARVRPPFDRLRAAPSEVEGRHEDLPCRSRAVARSADERRRHRAVDSRRRDAAGGARPRGPRHVPRSRRRPRPARRSTASTITSSRSRRRSIAGCAAVMLRGLWHYEGVRRVLARDRPGRRASPQPARRTVAEQGRRAEGEAGDLASQHGLRLGVRLCAVGSTPVQSGIRCRDARAGRVELHSRACRATLSALSGEIEDGLQRRRRQPVPAAKASHRLTRSTDSLCRARRRAQRRSRARRCIRTGDQQAAPERAPAHRRAAFLLGRQAVAVLPGAARSLREQSAHRAAAVRPTTIRRWPRSIATRRARSCRRCFRKRSG